MKTSANYLVQTLATGLVVLVLFAIVVFWPRFGVEMRLVAGLPAEARIVLISPSNLLPREAETSPDVTQASVARGELENYGALGVSGLGLVDYFLSMFPGGSRSGVFYEDENPHRWMYFDRPRGKLVLCEPDKQNRRLMTYYAGPEGLSDSSEVEVGRFVDPISADTYWTGIVYDRVLRRFYQIDTELGQVKVGPEVEVGTDLRPVQIGRQWNEQFYVTANWEPPRKMVPREGGQDDVSPRRPFEYAMPFTTREPQGFIPVIDASGRIDLLDTKTLELVRGAGYLPEPQTPYGYASSRPSQLLGFDVVAVGAGEGLPYIGLVACGLSRQGTSASVAVYDETGKQVSRADTVVGRHDPQVQRRAVPSAHAALWDVPWGPTLTILKYVLETIHPPLLTLASFWAVDHIEARAGHRALFLLPNSFVAMHRVQDKSGISWQYRGALWTMVPAFLLAGFLAWRVARDAAFLGLSRDVRRGWIIVTLAFSLPAYLTYRLTRPKVTMVTCGNCGRSRRPDGDRCHWCRSAWSVPELVPPAWRVLGGRAESAESAGESENAAPVPEQNPDSSVESM